MENGSYLIWTEQKPVQKPKLWTPVCLRKAHLFSRCELAWVLSARRERGFLEGGGMLAAERWAQGHVCRLKAHRVLLPTPSTLHSSSQGWQVCLDHSAGRQQSLRATGVNTALSWALLLTNLSSLNPVVSHWNNLMERERTPRETSWPRWAG